MFFWRNQRWYSILVSPFGVNASLYCRKQREKIYGDWTGHASDEPMKEDHAPRIGGAKFVLGGGVERVVLYESFDPPDCNIERAPRMSFLVGYR